MTDSKLILEETGGSSAGNAREQERQLRLFHVRSEGRGGGATGFVPPALWKEISSPADGAPTRSDSAALGLFLSTAPGRSQARREAFQRRVDDLARQLQDLLDVDRAKRMSRSPEVLGRSIGAVGDLVDAGALANQLGDRRGTDLMSPDRRRRLERVAEQLTAFSWENVPGGVVVRRESARTPLPEEAGDWVDEPSDTPCTDAAVVFDEYAERLSGIFGAVRVGTLEAAGRFEAERHGPWAEHLAPSSYSQDERELVPVVVACDNVVSVAETQLPGFTSFLLSDRPLHVILGADGAPEIGQGARLELGYLAVAHRKAFVQQSSLEKPEHLLAGMRRGFDHVRPALHLVLEATGPAAQQSIVSEAALRARVHPHFRYDPEAGTTWAGRMDFNGNPAPEEDWPEYEVAFERAAGGSDTLTLAFTVADWALLHPERATEFHPIPPGYANDTLTELGSYLPLDAEVALERIPYVWAADASGRLHRLVVTRRLVLRCREQLDFWHTLQELAGIRSEYVVEAVRRTREDLGQRADAERQQSADDHAAALAAARQDAVSQAVQTLSHRLLDPNLSLPIGPPSSATPSAPASSDAPPMDAAPADSAPVAASAGESNGDSPVAPAPSPTPWIDSPLCTSCNDCININSVLFRYDANKQAIIGDAKAGTYAQLVRAAEKCPARCIHPGLPLNPDEKGLEKLRKRAEAFQ